MFIGEEWASLGRIQLTSTIQTTTYSVASSDCVVVMDTTNDCTVTLPTASASGRLLIIKNVSTGNITIDGDGSDTIDGSTTKNVAQYEMIQVVDYFANKWVEV